MGLFSRDELARYVDRKIAIQRDRQRWREKLNETSPTRSLDRHLIRRLLLFWNGFIERELFKKK